MSTEDKTNQPVIYPSTQTNNAATEQDPVFPKKVKGDNKNEDVSLQIEDQKQANSNPAPLGILTGSASRGTKPFYLTFKNVFYQIPIGKNKTKTILNNVSGYFKSGEVTAIMGPSGCGKTSILNFLTDRIEFVRGAVHTSEIFLNSDPIEPRTLSEYTSYVMQDDVLVDVLTPVETLKFVAKLKKIKTEKEYDKEVEELIEILKIEKCKDTWIGNPTRKGLSGGEKKRVSIGVEIISNPSILFLDEPTSGLDSTTSGVIIEFLKELAKVKNMIIAFSIHQPSSNIFQHFDRMLILNKGELVYQGPAQEMDKAGNVIDGVVPYFDHELGIPLQVKANPCDAFMHIIEEQNAGAEGTHVIEDENLKSKPPLTESYKEKRLSKIDKEIDEILGKGEKCMIPKKNAKNVPYCTEFAQLLKRSWVVYIRNPSTLRIKCIMTLVYIFISLSIFWRLDKDYYGFNDRAGFLFFFSVNHFLSIIFGAILVFPQERPTFLRENQGKLYGVSTYYISKSIVETPLVLINNVIYSAIVYYLVDLRGGAGHFFMFLFIFFILAWMSHSMGYFFGTTFSDLNTATIITQFTVIPFFLFSGFLINVVNMPIWLSWLQYFSPFRFSIEASMKNEFEGRSDSPFDIIGEYNMDLGKWYCVICMFCWGVFYRTLGGICLKLLVRKTG